MYRLILVLLITAISSNLYASEYGEIHGMVKAESGEKLKGAQVAVNGFNLGSVATEYGHYHVTRVPVGEHEVVVWMTGYIRETTKVIVGAGETVELNFTLKSKIIELNPMVVTGTRTVKTSLESPVKVDVVPLENFELENSVNLAEGLSFTPGVRVENNCQNCNFTQLRMNGLEGPYTQILINGRATVSSLAGVYGLEHLPSAMIERLEVVKGGGSSLYGGSAVGGVVNVITHKPDIERTNLGIKLGWMNGKPDRAITASTSVLSDDRKIGAFMFGQNRERTAVDLNDDNFSELGMLKSNSFGGQFFYNPNLDIELSAELHVMSENRRGGDNITGTQPHEAYIAEAIDTRRLGGGLNFQHRLSAATEYDLYTSFAYTRRNSYYGGKDHDEETGLWAENLEAYGHTLNPLYMGGFQMNHRMNQKHLLSFGLEATSNGLEDRIPGYNRLTDVTYNTYGAFFQEDWQITPIVNAVLGARVDKHSEIDGAILSPRASLLFKLTENASLRTTFSTGYRPPVVFDEDLHITQVGGEGHIHENADDLEQEKSYSFSGGLEYIRDLDSGNGVFFSAGGFYTLLKDAFFVDYDRTVGDADIFVRTNAGQATVAGAEFEAGFIYRDRLSLRTGWTFQKSVYDEAQDISTDESVAIMTDEFLRTPNVYGFVTSKLTLVPRRVDLDLSLDVTGPMNVINEETNAYRKSTPWFGVFDMKLSVTLGDNSFTKWFIHGHNLLDSYQDDLDICRLTGDVYLRDAGYVYGPMRPRSFYMGIETGF
ncbi:MAG: TonB-dependent receptor [Gemmatimonadota bacterium]|nr:TonB-dependent receptor [Gemmatimonadota bacterium]